MEDQRFPWFVRLSADAKREVERRAAGTGVRPAALVRQVVEAFLSRPDDQASTA